MITESDIYNGLQNFRTYIEANLPFKTTCYFGTSDPSTGAGYTANIGSIYFRTQGNPATIINIFYKQTSSNTGWNYFLISTQPTVAPIEIIETDYEINGYVSYRLSADILQIFINATIDYNVALSENPVVFNLPFSLPQNYTNTLSSSETPNMEYVLTQSGNFELFISSDTSNTSETITQFIQIPITTNWHPD